MLLDRALDWMTEAFIPVHMASILYAGRSAIKLDGRGGHILFKIFPALGAGDRHDEVALL